MSKDCSSNCRPQTPFSYEGAQAFLSQKKQDCIDCDVCTYWCDLLTEQSFNIGAIAGYGADLAAYAAGMEPEQAQAGIAAYARDNAYLVSVVRSCYLCNQCTYGCPSGIKAPEVMAEWRRMLNAAQVIKERDSKAVAVDDEWDLFKVYRRIQQTWYDGVMLPDAQEGQVDTLFFPGCSLVSYAPELTQKVFDWLKGQSDCLGTVAMSDACCASPLISAGLKERADAFCEGLVAQMQLAGVKRIVFVCPGCEQRFLQYLPDDGSIKTIPLPALLKERGMTLEQIPETLAQPYAVFDSCNDRALRYGGPIRALLSEAERVEFEQSGPNARCCSAGGAVSAFKPAVCDQRKSQVLQECADKRIGTILTVCPTCASTFAQLLIENSVNAAQTAKVAGAEDAVSPAVAEGVNDAVAAAPGAAAEGSLGTLHYLEVLFDCPIDWNQVFANLQDMWTGQYAQWVYSVLV